jgi:hypothetical protein
MSSEKKEIQPISRTSIEAGEVENAVYDPKKDDFEIFKDTTDGVQFRLVGWVKASVIFLKSMPTSGRIRNGTNVGQSSLPLEF